jgi:hypothetical protein
MTFWAFLLLVSLALVFVFPYIAWNGRPRGFKRIHWFGLTVGAGLVGFILLFLGLATRDLRGQDTLTPVLWGAAAILIAVGIGSLVAVFFWRSNGTGS